MSQKKIEVGKTYRNCGAGTTWRKVQCISLDCRPRELDGSITYEHEPGVQYIDSKGRVAQLYLTSFARWAGSEVM